MEPRNVQRFSSGWWRAAAVLLGLLYLAAAGCGDAPGAPGPVASGDASATGSTTVRGVVREQLSSGPGEPIAGVDVAVLYKTGADPRARSGPDGRYEIRGVQPPPFQLEASKNGYAKSTTDVAAPSGDIAIDPLLTPNRRPLQGVVTDASTPTIAVSGATIEILTGSNRGRTAMTDGSGAYTVPDVWDDFDVEISRTGYESKTLRVSFPATFLSAALVPRFNREVIGFSGRLCADWAFWLPTSPLLMRDCTFYPKQAHHEVTVTGPGRLDVYFGWRYVEDYSMEYFWLEVRCGAARVEQLYGLGGTADPPVPPVKIGGGPGPLEVPVSAPGICEIKPSRFRSFKSGVAWTDYRLDVITSSR